MLHPNRSASKLLIALSILTFGVVLPEARAALVDLATTPLIASTTTTVQPNLLLVLDDSGSMTWTYLPDAADDFRTKYGYHSSQCNGVYYNPNLTYTPPLASDKTPYPNASFTAAHDNGFDTSSTTRDLNSAFIANRFVPEAANSTYSNYGSYLGNSGSNSLGPYGAFYYLYTGTVTYKDYNDTSSAFYTECNVALSSTSTVFAKRRLASTETTTIVVNGTSSTSVSGITVNGVQIMASGTAASTSSSTLAGLIAAKITQNGYSATATGSTVTISGPTSAANFTPVISKSGSMTLTADVFPDTTPAKLTNFANWYSYYRTRMQMMKTATGVAFSNLDDSYRVGLMKISNSGTPQVALDTFSGGQRSTWYTTFYNVAPTGSTPLREALANAGRYYAGKLSNTTDPLQYSCQQNFTILSTDGYWNGNDGFQLDGSTAVGNQDGSAQRPMNDGGQAGTTVTTTYTRDSYSTSTSGCSGGRRRLKTQPQTGTCSVTTVNGVAGSENCNWVNSGSAILGPTCQSSITLPNPNPSARVQVGSPVTTLGSVGGTSDTLADVAMYYYQTNLRTPALNNCGTVVPPATVGALCTPNTVFATNTDNNTNQHMTTFTFGLGASGRMLYSPSYLTDSSGDFVSVKLGLTTNTGATPPVCSWQSNGTVCNWPTPSSDSPANIDDLWHAAVNGRGAYFSAADPSSLSAGLANALASISTRKGNSAAAATSTLNPISGNNYAYLASYTTALWKGNLESRSINLDTGTINLNANWCVENVVPDTCASPGSIVPEATGSTTVYNCVTPNSVICPNGTLDGTNCKVPVAISCTGTNNGRAADTSDNRTIKTANAGATALIDFDAAYAAANPAHFAAAKVSQLSQWSLLSTAQQSVATGANLLNYLRGQYAYEDRPTNPAANRLFRYRDALLGDILDSQPVYLGPPNFGYPYPGYQTFASTHASRPGTIYLGANDGMLHAIAADTGQERWGYVPSMVIPNLWRLADQHYEALHQNYVNGNAATGDVCTANCSCDADCVAGGGTAPTWRTILVGGLGGGGRGYFALDITDPTAPTLLWEFTPTSGNGSITDDDLGYSYAEPIIVRRADGTWNVLVTSGYNNVSPGATGFGYLYVLDAQHGTILSKISTGVGSVTTPSGLGRITVWNNEPAGNLAGYVYGGDLLGNLWRFDLNSSQSAVIGTGNALRFATLFADTGASQPQPITTAPTLGQINGKRVIFVNTGKYLETSDLTTTQIQSQYAIKDDDATSTLVNPRTALVRQTLSNTSTGTRTGTSNTVNFYTGRGWFFDFPDTGERANVGSQLIQGTLLVPSIVPSNTACTPGGYGWINYVDYRTGGTVAGGSTVGLKTASPIVGVSYVVINNTPIPYVITSGAPPLVPPIPFSALNQGFTGTRVLWRELVR